MTSEICRKLMRFCLPLQKGRIIRRENPSRWFFVRLKANATSRPAVRPETLDGVREPLVEGQRAEPGVVCCVRGELSPLEGI